MKHTNYKSLYNLKLKKSHKLLRNLKSQAALEFLTTYGWAFLVILIMVSTLAYFGILSPSKLLPDRCNFGSEITCEDFKIAYGTTGADGTVNLRLRNSVGEPITISAATVTSDSKTPFACSAPAPTTLGTGEITELTFSTCNGAAAGLVRGEKTKIGVTITYYELKSGDTYIHDVKGDIFATVI